MDKCKFYVREEVFLTPTSEHRDIDKCKEYCIHPNFKKAFGTKEPPPISCEGYFPDKCILPNSLKYIK